MIEKSNHCVAETLCVQDLMIILCLQKWYSMTPFLFLSLSLPLSPLVGTVSYQKEDERVSFEFPQEITSSGATVLNIDYTGILNDQMKGFYRSKYTRPDEPEVERYTAVTQFEVRI